jgi:hypothetical protein
MGEATIVQYYGPEDCGICGNDYSLTVDERAVKNINTQILHNCHKFGYSINIHEVYFSSSDAIVDAMECYLTAGWKEIWYLPRWDDQEQLYVVDFIFCKRKGEVKPNPDWYLY